MLNCLKVLHLWSCDVSSASSRRSLRSIFYLGACERLRHLLLFALILNFDIRCGRIARIVSGCGLLMIVVHFANFVEPILLGRVEGLVRGSTARPLAMASDSTLPGSLPATLMPQEDGRAIRIVCVDIIEQLAAMMMHTWRLP